MTGKRNRKAKIGLLKTKTLFCYPPSAIAHHYVDVRPVFIACLNLSDTLTPSASVRL